MRSSTRRACCELTRSMSMPRGLAKPARMPRGVISSKVTRTVLLRAELQGFGQVPGDGFAFAVRVGAEVDLFGAVRGSLDFVQDLFLAGTVT